MNLQSYREDSGKQKDGVPIYVEDAVFYCRRYGTEESNEVLRKLSLELFGPFHKKKQEDADVLFAHWLVEYGIVNWEGVYDTDKAILVPYSKANCRGIFLNPEMFLSLNKVLYIDVNNFENYLHDCAVEDIEDIKKP